MNKNKTMLKVAIPAASVGVMLICIAAAFGHGGETHDEPSSGAELPVDSMSSMTATLDSVQTLIQKGFTELESVFKKGCFDCHTNTTAYPWYYKLPLIKGMIDADISEARKHLDMSGGFPFGGHGKPADDLVAISEEVLEGEMPPMSYRFMHWSAKPTDSERDSIVAWVERSLTSLRAIGVHPKDSDN